MRTPDIAPSPVLTLDGFTRAYRDLVAVDALSLSVAPGEILALVGPNGAGKTTTMRAVAGILPATRGSIVVAGHDVSEDAVAAKRRLAYIPDDPRLFDVLTVDEHLDYTAHAYRVADWQPIADRLLARFELAEHRRKPASELSRGMRQKVAICCSLLYDPALIMLDEPLTGLDPRGIRTIKEVIRERAAQGAALIVSSHLLQLVEDLCSRLLILHLGRRVFLGDMGEARRAFSGMDGADATLEDVFFRATEGASPASS